MLNPNILCIHHGKCGEPSGGSIGDYWALASSRVCNVCTTSVVFGIVFSSDRREMCHKLG